MRAVLRPSNATAWRRREFAPSMKKATALREAVRTFPDGAARAQQREAFDDLLLAWAETGVLADPLARNGMLTNWSSYLTRSCSKQRFDCAE